jgi:hypothetical protein
VAQASAQISVRNKRIASAPSTTGGARNAFR